MKVIDALAGTKLLLPESLNVRLHCPTPTRLMVPPDAVHTEVVLLVTVMPCVPLVTTVSPEVALAVMVTCEPTWGLVGAAERVTALVPLPTWNAVDVVLRVPSTAWRMIEPALDAMMLLNTAIPEELVVAVNVLDVERVPPLAADTVTVSLEIGSALPPSTCT